MTRTMYVESDEAGPMRCPNCGANLGSADDSHMTIRCGCGAETEWCIAHQH